MATLNTPSPTQTAVATTTDIKSPSFIPNVMSDIVAVKLEDSQIVHVHKNVLELSPFFKNALKPEWAEMRNGEPIDLSDEHPEIFADYVSWLYSHNVIVNLSSCNWAKLYVLGEKLVDVEFQDAMLTALIQECLRVQRYPMSYGTNIIYDGTTEGSPARRLLAEFFCYAGGEKWVDITPVMKDPPADFLTDIIRILMRVRKPTHRDGMPWAKNPESYLLQKKKPYTFML